ncbi:unnamed protein product, partial [Cyprideis torosa]
MNIHEYQAKELLAKYGVSVPKGIAAMSVEEAVKAAAFIELDAAIVEINPMIVTDKNEVMALDAKMNFDENALFRQKAVAEMRDESEEDENEREATNW